MNKKQLVAFSFILLLVVLGNVSAEEGSLGDESWKVEKRIDRIFYFTHGTTVWGHEFGFYKTKDCHGDILWLTFSARDEKIKGFDGTETLISLDVDGKDFRIKSTMHYMGVVGFTHVMSFYDWFMGTAEMDALTKGRYVKVQILEPKGLKALLDIKDDRFSLKGLIAAKKKTKSACMDETR
ncbi:MAG: hypothetical protein KKA59_08440 [Candidatus Omnitrophica bacterium]|nr:hypothetical protein [Candidatus Omnitrophota bacterium]